MFEVDQGALCTYNTYDHKFEGPPAHNICIFRNVLPAAAVLSFLY
jgi:hypothetical protein